MACGKEKPQRMVNLVGIPKGLHVVVKERGMTAEKLLEVLGSYPDLENEKSRIESFLTEQKGTIVCCLNFIVSSVQLREFGRSVNTIPKLIVNTTCKVYLQYYTIIGHCNS